MNTPDRQILDRLLDDDLSPAERGPILARLEADVEATVYLAERSLLLANLRASLERRRLQRAVAVAVPGAARPAWFGPWGPVQWAVAGALLILFTLGGYLARGPRGSAAAVVAEVVESQAAVPEAMWQAGARVSLRQVVLASGRVGLRLPNGVSLSLEGPLRAEFVSASRLRLRQGKATADVGKNGKGFIIETANARVVDLGTRFGVAVGASNETDVVVFEGKVDVFDPARRTAKSEPKITLGEGEAIRVGDSRKRRPVRMVALGADAQTLQGGAVSDIVGDVTDNLVAVGSQRFYGLVRASMGEGARLYTTGHSRTWHAPPGEAFPRELIGADVVCTFSAARREQDLEITIGVTRPCVLYVFPDARQPLPGWLRRDFTDTGLRLRSGPWLPRGVDPASLPPGEEEKTCVPYGVWKRTLARPGPVVLGTPCAPGHDDRLAMYGIAVKALP